MKKILITCHANADFDAFAGMLAARHLYDEPDLFFPGSLEAPLNKLYSSLDKKIYRFIEPHMIDWNEYEKLVLVDTRQEARVKHVAPLLKKEGVEIESWDHHPPSPDDLSLSSLHYEATGAVTSILCAALADKNVKLDPAEATLTGLGIYADTGSFTYSSTTEADFQAASWLLSQGMQVTELSGMAGQELTSLQIRVLGEMLASIKMYGINGLEIAFTEVDIDHYLGDVASLAHKVMEMENFEVLFALAHFGDRIQVVGRSRSNKVNVGEICAALGGGGHAYAASASIRFHSLSEVKEQILRLLRASAQPEKRAADYMSAPVIGIEANAPLQQANDLIMHFGLKAIPVFAPGTRKCEGIIDIETAARACTHGLGTEPVSEYMRRHIATLKPDAKLSEVTRVIVTGRQRLVPIVKKDTVIGVVTHTDLINIFTSESANLAVIKKNSSKPFKTNKLIQDRLPRETRNLLKLAGNLGTRLGLPVYAVGGFVRDLFLGHSNHDIDLVAEGNGITLARELAREMGGRVREHEKFLTSVVIYNDEKGVERHIDVATARLEYYEFPAALPTVELSSIKMDLMRRDFSINALAIRLDGNHFGQLEDFFGGRNDIKDGLIRVLHTLSFVEDPTRCLRAVRFEQRYGFRMGTGTEKLLKNTIALGLLEKLTHARVFNEYRHICEEDKAKHCFERLDELGILKTLSPHLALNSVKKEVLAQMQKLLAWHRLLFFEESAKSWICYFYCLCRGLSYAEADQNYKALGLPGNKRSLILRQRELIRGLRHKLVEWQKKYDIQEASVSDLCSMLAPVEVEGLLYLMAADDMQALHKNLSRYITQWAREKPDIDGHALIAAGIGRGPAIGKFLKLALEAKLNGIAPNHDAQMNLVLKKWREEQAALPQD